MEEISLLPPWIAGALLASIQELQANGHTVIGPARSSAEAPLMARREQLDCAFVDADLERTNAGLELACKLRDELDVLTTERPEEVPSSDCAVGLSQQAR